MSNRAATVLSIVAGMLLTAACLAFAAYEFYAPQWQVAIKGNYKDLNFGKIGGIRSDIKGMPLFAELKGEYKEGKFLKYGKVESVGTVSPRTGSAGPGELVLFRTLDRSSTKLAAFCAQGGHLDDLTIGAGHDDHKGSGVQYILHDVTISSITLRGPNAPGRMANGAVPVDQPVEEVTLSYGKIAWTYGSAAPPGAQKLRPDM